MSNIYDLLIRGEGIGEMPPEPEEVLGEKAIGRKAPGDIIKIAHKDYIVLGREDGGVAVITKDMVEYMKFSSTSGNYLESDVRSYCNETFYQTLAEEIGAENILMHTVDITADDGTGEALCDDYVSLITTERYRRYRKVLPALGKWWWTSTRVNADNTGYARGVCYVCSSGVLSWNGCDYDSGGVRPFLVLNPALLVD